MFRRESVANRPAAEHPGLWRTDPRRNIQVNKRKHNTGQHFGQRGGGGNGSQKEVRLLHTLVKVNRITGTYPLSKLQSKGGIIVQPPARRTVPSAPITYPPPTKNRGVCALHGLRAACKRVTIGLEAGWDTRGQTSPADVFPLPPRLTEKGGGVPLFDHFPNTNMDSHHYCCIVAGLLVGHRGGPKACCAPHRGSRRAPEQHMPFAP